jgi:hypothetical protein
MAHDRSGMGGASRHAIDLKFSRAGTSWVRVRQIADVAAVIPMQITAGRRIRDFAG